MAIQSFLAVLRGAAVQRQDRGLLGMAIRSFLAVLLLLLAGGPPVATERAQAAAARNVRGIHTLAASRADVDAHLAWAERLVGPGGAVTQPFQGIGPATEGPSADAVHYVEQAYARDLTPILVLQGRYLNRDGCNPTEYVGWLAPTPDEPGGAYRAEAEGYRRFVAGLPRHDGRTLWVQVGNEPNLHEMWGGAADPAAYARFFADVSAAIRSLGDPRIRILNAALAPEGSVDNLRFIAEAVAAEPRFAASFDDWATHPYPRNQPPERNLHDGTALAGSRYTIDAYLLELDVLAAYGVDTSGLGVVLTETGYELGDRHFAQFPAVTEEERAAYMQRAFAEHWPRWPEVRAVTPFQLAGWYGSWQRFDWVWPSSTTTARGLPTQPRLQYAALVPGAGVVQGRVADDAGYPVKDVALVAEPGGFLARTVADGTFLLIADPGTYAVHAEAPGYGGSEAADVRVVAGERTPLDLVLPARPPAELANADFEAADLAPWTAWGTVDGPQDGPWFQGIATTHGARFLGSAVNCGAKDGGVLQTVQARPGGSVVARTRALTYGDGAVPVRVRIGVDPTGGTDPTADRIVWSAWVETDGVWGQIAVGARAAADRMTILLEHDQDAANPWNLAAFDAVELTWLD